LGTVLCTTFPSTLNVVSHTPAPGSLALNVTSLIPLTVGAVASSPPMSLAVGPAGCSRVMSAA
jgi:hypothetical protein